MTDYSSDETGATMIHVTAALLEEAQALLEDRGGIDRPVEIPSTGSEVNAVLSPTPKGIIALKELTHAGKKYYLGIPDAVRADD